MVMYKLPAKHAKGEDVTGIVESWRSLTERRKSRDTRRARFSSEHTLELIGSQRDGLVEHGVYNIYERHCVAENTLRLVR